MGKLGDIVFAKNTTPSFCICYPIEHWTGMIQTNCDYNINGRGISKRWFLL